MVEYRIPVLEDFPYQKSVLNIQNSPPAASKGDRYIVGSSPTGVWSGHADEMATYDGVSAWEFDIPNEGTFLYNTGAASYYSYTGGTWTAVSFASAGWERHEIERWTAVMG